jgi:trimeric autotransporter adhesin
MYSLIQLRRLVPLVLVCLALLPRIYAQDSPRFGPKSHQVRASIAARERPVAPASRPSSHQESPLVLPPPDGVYSGNTAEGSNALHSLSTGQWNTALGWESLANIMTNNFNTGVGAGTLALNTADGNTATGAGALLLNTTAGGNTANGAFALIFNNTSVNNTAVGFAALENNDDTGTPGGAPFNDAVGANALFSNVTGFSNNALGESALFFNVDGAENTAVGDLALTNNDNPSGSGTANFNTAVGASALASNSTGGSNNAVGSGALIANTTAGFNEAMGVDALSANTTGDSNVAIGDAAMAGTSTSQFCTMIGWDVGPNLTDFSSDDIYIGATAGAAAAGPEIGTIRIGDPSFVFDAYMAGIYLNPNPGLLPVFVDANGHLSSTFSSERFKKDIGPMDKTSEAIYSLKPVTFHYKKDKTNMPQFGLIAEQVAKVNPDLIVRDKEEKPFAVRYDQINAMLLNEFLKEHQTVQALKATAEKQQATIAALTASLREQAAQIQKVSAQLETIKPAPQVVENR